MRGNYTNYLSRQAEEKAVEAALKREASLQSEAEELKRAEAFNTPKGKANTPWPQDHTKPIGE